MRCFTKFILILAAAVLLLNAAERFDYLVRADFFAGMAGDPAAMARAMKVCEEALAKEPENAEAMVWHGSGMVFQSGQAFQKGDAARGGEMWALGMEQMKKAVELAPDHVGVLIPRGATLLNAAQYVPNADRSRELTEQGVADYQKVYEIQKPVFDTLSGHSRGELLFGLAGGYSRLGDQERAKKAFTALLAVGKASGHEAEAKQWLETGSYKATAMQCTGCHTGK